MAWEFFAACEVADLVESRPRRIDVEGFRICLVSIDGRIHACADACPHERVSLGDGGRIEGCEIVCGAHHWRFDIRTGRGTTDPKVGLRRFPVGRKDGWVYVGFWDGEGPEPPVP